MQNHSQGRRETKATPGPELPGLRAKGSPAEVVKNFATGVVTECVRLNIRETPDRDGKVVAIIDLLTDVVVDLENSTDEFYKISTATGVAGFCMKKYIALRR